MSSHMPHAERPAASTAAVRRHGSSQRLWRTLAACLWLLGACLCPSAPAAAEGDEACERASGGTLVVTVVDIPAGGVLYAELHDVPAPARDVRGRRTVRWGEARERRREEVSAGERELRFDALPAGRYAVRAFLDRNGNETLDMNARGIPQEPFAFSNDASARLGPPRIDAAAFTHGEGETHIALRMRSASDPPPQRGDP